MLDLLGGPDSALLVVNSSPQEAERFLRLSVKEKDKGNPPRCRQLQSRALARLRRSLEHADVVLASSLITRRLGKRRETAARVETVSPSGSGEGFVNCDEESPDRDERHRFTHFVLICKPTDEERETESETPEEEKRKFAGRVEEEDERTVKPNGDSEMRGVVDGKQAVCGGGRAQKRRGRAEKKSDPHGEETCMSLSPSCTQEAVDTDEGAGKEPSERESRKEDAGEKGKKPAASTVLPFLLRHSRAELISRKENVTAAADASPHLQDRREREALHREETKGRQAERDEEERREDEREEERGASRNVLREGIPSVVISCSSSSSTAATTPCQQLHRVHAFPRSPRRRETSDAREEEQDFQQEERRDTDRMREGNKETVSGERETLGGRKTDSEDFGEFEREGASLSMTGENDAKTEASCCVTVSPCTRGSHAKAREEGEEETLETPRVLRRIWCVPPLCCFAARSEKREFRAVRLKLKENTHAQVKLFSFSLVKRAFGVSRSFSFILPSAVTSALSPLSDFCLSSVFSVSLSLRPALPHLSFPQVPFSPHHSRASTLFPRLCVTQFNCFFYDLSSPPLLRHLKSPSVPPLIYTSCLLSSLLSYLLSRPRSYLLFPLFSPVSCLLLCLPYSLPSCLQSYLPSYLVFYFHVYFHPYFISCLHSSFRPACALFRRKTCASASCACCPTRS
uniref:Transmembrane protein n=1 Tax=Toxoplasma gondii (strain ATCC 50861 / VEG) TaxID=432359 RepID=A0A0F7UZH5_TOXGV|nr:TPA: hypothetical protein BN1205_015830 [Toxoplasma gondii VEG]